jgi:hypothetical protein
MESPTESTVDYDPEEMCASLPGWIAQDEIHDKEETSKGVPCAQFWKKLRTSLALDCIFGCSPLRSDNLESKGLPGSAAFKIDDPLTVQPYGNLLR